VENERKLSAGWHSCRGEYGARIEQSFIRKRLEQSVELDWHRNLDAGCLAYLRGCADALGRAGGGNSDLELTLQHEDIAESEKKFSSSWNRLYQRAKRFHNLRRLLDNKPSIHEHNSVS
jgi:hypothetical protein